MSEVDKDGFIRHVQSLFYNNTKLAERKSYENDLKKEGITQGKAHDASTHINGNYGACSSIDGSKATG